MSSKFCANDKCGCHIDVADTIGAVQFKVDGVVETRNRVTVKRDGEPLLTLCDVCCNVLKLQI